MSIHPVRHTYGLIKKYKEFVISVPTIDMLRDVLIAGRSSGPEKLKKMSVTFIQSKEVKTPSIKEAAANIECRVVEEKSYGNYAFFAAEAVNFVQNEEAFKNNQPDVKLGFMAHLAPGTNKFVVFDERVYEISPKEV